MRWSVRKPGESHPMTDAEAEQVTGVRDTHLSERRYRKRTEQISPFPTEQFGPFLEKVFRAFRATMLCAGPLARSRHRLWHFRADREQRSVSQLVRLLLRNVLTR